MHIQRQLALNNCIGKGQNSQRNLKDWRTLLGVGHKLNFLKAAMQKRAHGQRHAVQIATMHASIYFDSTSTEYQPKAEAALGIDWISGLGVPGASVTSLVSEGPLLMGTPNSELVTSGCNKSPLICAHSIINMRSTNSVLTQRSSANFPSSLSFA